MFDPQNPQEPTLPLRESLKKKGIRMNKRTKPGSGSSPIGSGVGGSVKIADNGNPNSRSSYYGI